MSDGDAGGGAAAPADNGGGGSPDNGGIPDNGQPATTSDDNGANNNNNDFGAAAVTTANNDFGEMAAPYGVSVGNHNHDQDHDAALDRPPDLAYNQGRIGVSSPFQPRVHEYRPTVRQHTIELDEYFVC